MFVCTALVTTYSSFVKGMNFYRTDNYKGKGGNLYVRIRTQSSLSPASFLLSLHNAAATLLVQRNDQKG